MDKCYLCKSKKVDDIQYGEFLRNAEMGFGVHTFCLYLSSNLTQNGQDDEGYLGFLKADIKDEERRVSHLRCCYCREKYANIGCCEKRCHRAFHLICGMENGAENQFCQSFRSYCHGHRRKGPKIPEAETTCTICYEKLLEPNTNNKKWRIVQSPCCRNGWFHKLCLQKFAKTAGYFFKCPLCNDAKVFRQKLPAQGIFIPNQDAAWELEPNAFVELLERPSECAATVCENKNGRNYTSHANPLILCGTCGSTAMHKRCLPQPNKGRFYCADCTIAFHQHDRDDENDDEAEEIDVCHVSDNEDLNMVQRLFGHDEKAVHGDDDDFSDAGIRISHPHRSRILSSDSSKSDLPSPRAFTASFKDERLDRDDNTQCDRALQRDDDDISDVGIKISHPRRSRILSSDSSKSDTPTPQTYTQSSKYEESSAANKKIDTCFLCKSSNKDDIQYGDFLRSEEMEMGVHTFCLYLSSNLTQNGTDEEGFLGFLIDDIKKEEIRISHLKCFYCRKKYANIGCCEKKCRRTFHLICGIENNAQNQFCNSFKSYCFNHRRRRIGKPPPTATCSICYDLLGTKKWGLVKSPCCFNGWFHKFCLQKFAKTAGYFFKCPLCNDAKTFRQKLPALGIFIPNQDAAWELEPNAFAELLERPNECSAIECENREGRRHSSAANPLLLCRTCGSTAVHKKCLPKSDKNRFHCKDCTIAMVEEEEDSGRYSLNSETNGSDNKLGNASYHENMAVINGLMGDDENSSDDEIKTQRRYKNRLWSVDSQAQAGSNNKKRRHKRPSTIYSTDDDDDEVEIICDKANPCQSHESLESLVPVKNETNPGGNNSGKEKLLRWGRIITDSSDDEVTVEVMPAEQDKSNKTLNSKTAPAKPIKNDEEYVPKKLPKIINDGMKTSSSATLLVSFEEVHKENPNRSHNKIRRVIRSDEEDDDVKKDHMKSVNIDTECSSNVEASYKDSVGNCNNRSSVRDFKTFTPIDGSSDDDIDIHNSKNSKLKTMQEIREISTEEKSDEDDDPLENFTKLVERQKDISCIAQRTRTRVTNRSYPEEYSKKANKALKTRKTITFQNQKQESSTKHDNLDVSCIARRTRRKSTASEHVNSKDRYSGLSASKQLNAPCVTIRTLGRRKTVCSETVTEKKRRETQEIHVGKSSSSETIESCHSYEISAVYDKKDQTEEESEDCENDRQNDGKLSPFELSCIAKRTRRRKSSSQTEDKIPTSSYSLALSNRYNHAWPRQNELVAFSKLRNKQNYYPSNNHHPHVNNRKRN
ncbi:uncharacterized protein LOC101897555 [Musca domestica]|uniref:Uncharacterized protein LOC101897555 n=1 Tax=Musca domestica TaxID=7370 RepID=A0A9J7CKS2_MUSDO|nr:uncharacterized protein LOC101897555 [Musca domestica]